MYLQTPTIITNSLYLYIKSLPATIPLYLTTTVKFSKIIKCKKLNSERILHLLIEDNILQRTYQHNNFPNKLVNQQINLYLQNINKNNNPTNINNTDRINLYYRNQMHSNYKLDKQAIINMIKRHIKPIEKQKQIKLIIYHAKFKI